MLTAQLVANYFLRTNDPEAGEGISNLKLQKLVYYAQGFYLALNEGEKLFEDPITAWEHGPVVESLYHKYKQYGSNEIPLPPGVNIKLFTKKQQDVLDEVFQVYGQFSAWKLRNMTHSEKPWIETPINEEISIDLMCEFFKTLLVA